MAEKEKSIPVKAGEEGGDPKSAPRKWSWGDFLRQLLPVVAGILITFQGSSWITRHDQKRQMKEILTSVRSELELNKRFMENGKALLERELEAARFFSKHLSRLKDAPRDSMEMYADVPLTLVTSRSVSDALQVLKASSNSINVMDKALLQEIFSCYNLLDVIFFNLNYYFDRKTTITDAFWENTDNSIIANYKEDPLPFFESYYASNAARNLLFNSEELLKGNAASMGLMADKLDYMMRAIDGYIDGKKITDDSDRSELPL